VAAEAHDCTRCDLYRNATQTVFGEGPAHPHLFVIGEQPGDHEDVAGAPFVGPAGRVLDDAFEAASIDRGSVYVTNAVKHFKWTPRGKRRIHDRPNRTEIVACHAWLATELEKVKPDVVVALGAVAGQSLWGPSFRVGAAKGQLLDVDGRPAVATVHPSAILRARDGDDRRAAMAGLVEDLQRAATLRPTPAGKR
jgi:DNA polymerase